MGNRTFTAVESQAFTNFEPEARAEGMVVDRSVDDAGFQQNLDAVERYYDQNPTLPVTLATLRYFVKTHRHELVFRTPTQQRYDKLAKSFTEQQRNQIAGVLAAQRLWPDKENEQLENWNLVASELLRRNFACDQDHIRLAISNAHATPGQRLIEERQSKFDAAKAVEQQRKQRETFKKDEYEAMPKYDGGGGFVHKFKPRFSAEPTPETPARLDQVRQHQPWTQTEQQVRDIVRHDIRSNTTRQYIEENLLRWAERTRNWETALGRLNAYLSSGDRSRLEV